MRYYLDSEFIENGVTIDLISIGIVADDGREYYAINSECDFSKASDWVLENVLRPIGLDRGGFSIANLHNPWVSANYKSSYSQAKVKCQIAHEVAIFLGCKAETLENGKTKYYLDESKESPEIWGEWCSYDWVCFAQLFGTMMSLPDGFPMRCRDVIQWKEDHLQYKGGLPASLETYGNHNALLGAKTVKMRYEFLENLGN